jgi:hypothetical protein
MEDEEEVNGLPVLERKIVEKQKPSSSTVSIPEMIDDDDNNNNNDDNDDNAAAADGENKTSENKPFNKYDFPSGMRVGISHFVSLALPLFSY